VTSLDEYPPGDGFPAIVSNVDAQEEPASLEARVNAALDVCQTLVESLPPLIDRIVALEKKPKAPAGVRRSDYRFERYPAPAGPEEAGEQRDRVEAAFSALSRWADWVVATFRLTTEVPACWPEHAALVEELAALFVSWIGAWLDNASPDAPAAFHERLHRAKTRLGEGNWGIPRCAGQHDGTGRDNAQLFAQWAARHAKETAFMAARKRTVRALPAPQEEPSDPL
jgi:hypothetical protein